MKIFVSYRRDDTKDLSRLIADYLATRFGRSNVFFDSKSIGSGEKWRRQLIAKLNACDALVAVIGNQWFEVRDQEDCRRIDNPDDFVRNEILTALDLGIPIIPILVEGMQMPAKESLPGDLQRLHEFQWFELRSEQYFESDVALLCKQLDSLPTSKPRMNWPMLVCSGLVFFVAGFVIGWSLPHQSGTELQPAKSDAKAERQPTKPNGPEVPDYKWPEYARVPIIPLNPKDEKWKFDDRFYFHGSVNKPPESIVDDGDDEPATDLMQFVRLQRAAVATLNSGKQTEESVICVRLRFENIWKTPQRLDFMRRHFAAFDDYQDANVVADELGLPKVLEPGETHDVTIYFHFVGRGAPQSITLEIRQRGKFKHARWHLRAVPYA